jgi:HSP20 family protein
MTNAVQTTSAPNSAPHSAQNPAPARVDGNDAQPYVLPPVDVFENENAITLLADLPGVPRDQLHVRVDGDNLVIEATATTTSGPENMELVYGELQCPAFRRQFTLSRELDASRIEAQLRDGVLRLTIPKSEEARPRRIQVQSG